MIKSILKTVFDKYTLKELKNLYIRADKKDQYLNLLKEAIVYQENKLLQAKLEEYDDGDNSGHLIIENHWMYGLDDLNEYNDDGDIKEHYWAKVELVDEDNYDWDHLFTKKEHYVFCKGESDTYKEQEPTIAEESKDVFTFRCICNEKIVAFTKQDLDNNIKEHKPHCLMKGADTYRRFYIKYEKGECYEKRT